MAKKDLTKEMMLAIQENNLIKFKELINNPLLNINKLDEHGNSLLSMTIFYDRDEMFDILLENGCEVNTNEVWPPLMIAVKKNKKANVEKLCDRGAYIENGSSTHNPKIIAITHHYDEIAKILMDEKYKDNVQPAGSEDAFNILLKEIDENLEFERNLNLFPSVYDLALGYYGDEGETYDEKNTEENEKITSFFDAIQKNDINEVYEMLQSDPWLVNCHENINDEATPLISAVYNESEELVDLFIKSEADLDDMTYSGDTALIAAVMVRNYNIVKKLLNAGADMYIEDIGGLNAFKIAISQGYAEIVDLFIQKEFLFNESYIRLTDDNSIKKMLKRKLNQGKSPTEKYNFQNKKDCIDAVKENLENIKYIPSRYFKNQDGKKSFVSTLIDIITNSINKKGEELIKQGKTKQIAIEICDDEFNKYTNLVEEKIKDSKKNRNKRGEIAKLHNHINEMGNALKEKFNTGNPYSNEK